MSKLPSAAGCVWTVAPTHLGLSVPIGRMRTGDWIFLLWMPWVPHQHHPVNDAPGGAAHSQCCLASFLASCDQTGSRIQAPEFTASCHEKKPLHEGRMSRGPQSRGPGSAEGPGLCPVTEVASCLVLNFLIYMPPLGPSGSRPSWPRQRSLTDEPSENSV